jgi:hypothetical protein
MEFRQELSFKVVMFQAFSLVAIEPPPNSHRRKIWYLNPRLVLFNRGGRAVFLSGAGLAKFRLKASINHLLQPSNILQLPSHHHSCNNNNNNQTERRTLSLLI